MFNTERFNTLLFFTPSIKGRDDKIEIPDSENYEQDKDYPHTLLRGNLPAKPTQSGTDTIAGFFEYFFHIISLSYRSDTRISLFSRTAKSSMVKP
ncbi:hypothetical protein EZS27_019910 [termite gut metagenome]|uniref:Uncharacterized protein n=1 Tax=termite gut metagenome TaxID=433724 RepID=A0A5J4RDC7_9ZZZZ